MSNQYQYPGKELTLFQEAIKWKKYFRRKIHRFLQGSILEVGAGLGGTAKILNDGSAKSWTLLEPDERLYKHLLSEQQLFPANTRIVKGSISDLHQNFDAVLYIDVLEHIENDKAELTIASSRIANDGYLVVLSPAFNFLFSEFDKAIGHYRRYTKKDLRKITPVGMRLISVQYLDSFGLLASLANKFFLHRSYPSQKQIWFWDKCLIPISKITDPLFLYLFGKTILAVWEKP